MTTTNPTLKMGHYGRVIQVDESITPTTLTPTTLFDDDQPELVDQNNETNNHVFSDSSVTTPIFPVKISGGIPGATNHDDTSVGNGDISSSYCPYNDILQIYDKKTHQLQFYFVKEGQASNDNTTFQFLNDHITVDNCSCNSTNECSKIIYSCYFIITYENNFDVFLFVKARLSEKPSDDSKEVKKPLPFVSRKKELIDFLASPKNLLQEKSGKDLWKVSRFTSCNQELFSILSSSNNFTVDTNITLSHICPVLESRHCMFIFSDGTACELSFQNYKLTLCSSFKLLPQTNEGIYSEILSYQQFLICYQASQHCVVDVWDISKQKKVGIVDLTPNFANNDYSETLSRLQISNNGLLLSAVGKNNSVYIIDIDSNFQIVKKETEHNQDAQFEDNDDDDTEDDEEEEDQSSDEELGTSNNEEKEMGVQVVESLLPVTYAADNYYQSHWYDNTEPPKKSTSVLFDSSNSISSLEKDLDLTSPLVVANKTRKETLLKDSIHLRKGLSGNLESNYEHGLLSRKDSRLSSSHMLLSPRREENISHIGEGLLLIHNPFNSTMNYLLTNDKCYITHKINNIEKWNTLQIYDVSSGKLGHIQVLADVFLAPLFPTGCHCICISNNSLDHGIYHLNFNITKNILLNNLIKYERQRLAEKLCDLNGWDRQSLSVHAIELGLRNRELSVVQDTLRNLDPQQELNVCYIIAKFIQETKFSRDSEFKIQTITTAIGYILSLIEKRINELGRNPNFGLGEEDPNLFDSIFLFQNKHVPIITESANSVIKKLEIRNPRKMDKLMESQTVSEIDEITTASNDIYHSSSVHMIAIIEDIMSSKKTLSKPEEILLLSNIVALLRSCLLMNEEEHEEMAASQHEAFPQDHLSVLSSIPASNKNKNDKKVDITPIDLSLYNDNFNDLSYFGSEIKTGISLNNEEDMYNYDQDDDDEISDADEKNEVELFERILTLENETLFKKWKQMDNKSIITESLLNGVVSLGFSFLKNRAMKIKTDLGSDSDKDERDTNCDIINFETFKEVAFKIVYEKLSLGEYTAALEMIENLGEDLVEHMRDIAFNTLDKNIRNYLIKELTRLKKFNEEELEVIEFLQLLEELYPDINILRVQEKLHNLGYANPFHEESDLFEAQHSEYPIQIGDISDMGQISKASNNVVASSEESPSSSASPKSDTDDVVFRRRTSSLMRMKSPSIISKKLLTFQKSKSSYLVTTLRWVMKWDKETRERILLEKDYHDNESLRARLSFCIAHHDYVGIVRWAKSVLPLTQLHSKKKATGIQCVLTEQGDITYTSEHTTSKKASSTMQNCNEILEIVKDQLKYCSPMMKEILLNSLALRGIFVQEDTSDFISLLKRFCATYQLFSVHPVEFPMFDNDPILLFDNDRDPAPSINTSSLHPQGELSKFHKDFISFCIDKNLPSICFRYVDKFDLWECLEESKIFPEESKPDWLKMILLSKKNRLFDLSMVNARSVLGIDNHSINSMMNENPLIALSTQMYSPKTLHEAMKEPSTSEHYLNRTTLSKELHSYPTFHNALFGEKNTPSLSRRVMNEEEQSKNGTINLCAHEISRGNIISNQKDISLYEMLIKTNTDISIEDILNIEEDELQEKDQDFSLLQSHRSLKLDFTDNLYGFSDHSCSIEETLDVEYYLVNKRPLEAYKELLHSYREKNKGIATLLETGEVCSPYLYGEQFESIGKYLPKEEQKALCQKVRSIAIHNFADQSITACCRMFIELCCFDVYTELYSNSILIDTKAARRIAEFHASFKIQNEEKSVLMKKLADDLVSIEILEADDSTMEKYVNSPQYRVLKLLEEATDSMLIVDISVKDFLEKEFSKSTNESAYDKVQILDGMRNTGNKIYVSPWKLLCIFCEIHNLPEYVHHLQTAAKRGQWISFLYHAQDGNVPLSTVMSIVQQYMPDSLKQFLLITLREMKSKQEGNAPLTITTDSNNNDALLMASLGDATDSTSKLFLELIRTEELMTSKSSTDIINYLLNKSISMSEPLLAIIATCYISTNNSNVEIFACMKTWLQSIKQRLSSVDKKGTDTMSIQKLTTKKLLEAIEKQIQDFCSNNFLKDEKQSGVNYIIQAFQLFDSTNPIASFLSFYEAYLFDNYERATNYLQQFVSAVKDMQNGKTLQFKLGDLNWLIITSTALAQQLSRCLVSQFKRTKFLELLHSSQFSLAVDMSNEFESMYSLNCLLERVINSGVVIETDKMNVFTGQPSMFIESLIENNCFKEARQVAVMFRKKINFPTDKITLAQANHKIAKVKGLFSSTHELTMAYSKVNDLFIKFRYPQEEAAKYFLEQVLVLQKSISMAGILHLLNLSLRWFEGTYSLTKRSVELSKPVTPSRPTKDLEFLSHSIMLLSNSQEESSSPHISGILASLESRLIETSKKSSSVLNIEELLDKVIDNLLLSSQYDEAKRLSSYYNYESRVLEIIDIALSMAKSNDSKTLYQDSEQKYTGIPSKILPSHLYKQLKEVLPNIDEVDDIQQILDKLQLLCYGYKMKGARNYLKIIALNYRIGRILQLNYESIVTKDSYDVLKLLLMLFGKEKLKVCSSFIQLKTLDTDRAACVCAHYLFNTYAEYYRNEDLSIFKNQDETEILIEDYFQNNAGSTSSDDLDDRLSTSSGSSFSSFDFSTSYSSVATGSFFKQAMAKNNKPPKPQKESQKQFDLVKCTMDEFAEFANICRDPSAIARHLIHLVDAEEENDSSHNNQGDSPGKKTSRTQKHVNKHNINLKCKVELIVRAYHCYHMSSSFEGIESILKRIKGPLIQEILDEQDFSLIVRLLVTIPDFSELTFLFDILIENEQFELILKKNSQSDQDNNNQLKMALSSYVQTKFPEQNEKLAMVYLRFNMLKEYGTYLFNKGCRGIKVIHRRIVGGDSSDATSSSSFNYQSSMDEHVPLEHVCKIVCENFDSAASSLTKEDCCQTAVRATNLSALVKLQLKFYNETPNKKKLQNMPMILELSPKDARTFIQNHGNFEESLIVANAYDINTMSDWIDPIYNNCVKKGDVEYLHVLKQYLPISSNLFREIAKRVKIDSKPLNTKVLTSFHKFLSQHCSDYKVVMDICEDMLHFLTSSPPLNSSSSPIHTLFSDLNKHVISILDYVPPNMMMSGNTSQLTIDPNSSSPMNPAQEEFSQFIQE
ncbi:hypothetical protein C9374_014587 [Naegleria lovaniensis]|uniref:Spatacsin C-terminal domain-containing protein n=1 Tax=Naegleria lovaniensis TaxID=51637 RepID=A0AA88KUG8_NAELO|nr:uncharacterized protein C9374_014587 [Naegleria lovaniensis]KAG2389187.1 hypothetical protein C9374_014587 [Naegleria lovaniensis]